MDNQEDKYKYTKSHDKEGREVLVFPAFDNLEVRREVLTVDDIVKMVPALRHFKWLVRSIMHFLEFDEVNAVHSRWYKTPGVEFARRMVDEDFKIPLIIDNEDVLANMPDGAFITVSNHPFGSIDGIALIDIVGKYYPDFKVMVNMILNQITALHPNFIAVDAWASPDPERRKVSVNGIRDALRQLKEGKPMGFFPAGAMSKTDKDGLLVDRPWQPTILQIIQRAKVPVVPIYFHGNNTKLFNFLGHHAWQLRSALLAKELFKKKGKPMRISIGQPISVEQQAAFGKDFEALGEFLRKKTYELSGYPEGFGMTPVI